LKAQPTWRCVLWRFSWRAPSSPLTPYSRSTSNPQAPGAGPLRALPAQRPHSPKPKAPPSRGAQSPDPQAPPNQPPARSGQDRVRAAARVRRPPLLRLPVWSPPRRGGQPAGGRGPGAGLFCADIHPDRAAGARARCSPCPRPRWGLPRARLGPPRRSPGPRLPWFRRVPAPQLAMGCTEGACRVQARPPRGPESHPPVEASNLQNQLQD
jgi:hypothetical protein